MGDLFRIIAAVLMLYMQQLGRQPFKFVPIQRTPIVVVATATSAPPPTATMAPSLTATATPTASFTSTATAVFTSTATAVSTSTATVPPSATPTASATTTSTTPFTPTPTTGAVPSSQDPTGFQVTGVPPAQKLPSAVLIYPLVRTSPTEDTRLEMMNLTASTVSVECFYVSSVTCNEIGFFLNLTPSQPVSWKARSGTTGNAGRIAPPFVGDGELKCVVVPSTPSLSSYNALQGRALVSNSTGQTIGYSAIGFQRLSPGDFTGVVQLDGVSYEQCPDRLHFHGLANQSGSDSELVLVPCSEDLLNQIPSSANVQLAVINEFEQRFSGATGVTCFNRIRFSSLPGLRRSSVGTDTAHIIVRGTDVPLIGLVIDRFTVPGSGAPSTSSNEPNLEGGRSATITLP